jgi:4-aminobutyrate aminotransferase
MSWLDPTRPVPDVRTALPGPAGQAIIDGDLAVTSGSLPRAYPLVPKRALGSVVEDADGNLFLDCNAGIAVTSTGHCHPSVVAAVSEQAGELLLDSARDF